MAHVNYKIKKGERFLDLYERAVNFYEETVSNSKSENIVLITHASVIRSIISYVLDFPLNKAFNLQIDFSGVSKVIYNMDSELSSVVFLNITADYLKPIVKD